MTAGGNFVAGKIGEATGGESGEMSRDLVLDIYWKIGWVAIGISVLVLAVSPFVKRWMHIESLERDAERADQAEIYGGYDGENAVPSAPART